MRDNDIYELLSVGDVLAEPELWRHIDGNETFRDFVDQCVTHFIHFVIPRRDQTQVICQDYPLPKGMAGAGGERIVLTRRDSGNAIFVEWGEVGSREKHAS